MGLTLDFHPAACYHLIAALHREARRQWREEHKKKIKITCEHYDCI